jgi:hypothetical protein
MSRITDTPNDLNPPSPEEETRKESPMRSKLIALTAAAILVAAAPSAFAQSGGGMKSGLASAATTSVVTVTIPGVVGIDIETDVAIDLSSYVVGGIVHANGGVCPANTFPPPAGCTAAATYAATGATTTGGAPAPAPAPNNIWMAVFCSKTGAGPLTLQGQVAATWLTGPVGGPGFPTTDLRNMRSASNNAPTAGNAAATNFATSATSIGIGTLGATTFGWTRVDQLIDLAVTTGSATTFNAGTYTTTATFTIAKS